MGTKTKKSGAKARSPKVVPAPDDREFILKFAGQPDEISAATFLESLSGITSVAQEANIRLGNGQPLDIKIRAPRPGSFLVNLILDPQTADHVANLFGIAGGLVGALAATIKLWRFLRGAPPASIEKKSDDTVQIENAAGKVIIEDQKIANFVFNNSTVTFNLARTFGALEGDPKVTGLEVLDREQEQQLVIVPRADFAALAVAPTPTHVEEKRDILVRTPVTIIKPSFDQKLRWEIVYNGIRIGAVVTDKRFYDSIDTGALFGKGDTLDVSLRARQEYDPTLKTHLTKSYEIVTVHAHIRAASQSALFEK
jgi:hypothetical protein